MGKTLWQTELAASLILQVPFMGNPEWTPAPGHHRVILWWTDQPRVDSAQYLKACGLMDPDGTLHPQIIRLYSEEDSLDWGDQGIDVLLRITTAKPGAVLLTDSFYSNVRGIFGDDMDPGSGGALIDVQSTIDQAVTGHLCTFHSPSERRGWICRHAWPPISQRSPERHHQPALFGKAWAQRQVD